MAKLTINPEACQLTRTQTLVLSAAARQENGSVVLPERLKGKAAESVGKALINKGLAREVRAKMGMFVWRRDPESGRSFALVITKPGRASLAVEASIAVANFACAGQSMPTDEHPTEEPPQLKPALAAADGPKSGNGRRLEQPSSEEELRANPPRPGSKLADVIKLLGREDGATVDELMTATGWLPHTTRAALTGLRKRGFVILRERPEGKDRTYRVPSTSSAHAA